MGLNVRPSVLLIATYDTVAIQKNKRKNRAGQDFRNNGSLDPANNR
jgi:hypothetical protein